MESNLNAETVLSIPNTQLYSIQEDTKTLLLTGDLELFYVDSENLYLLSLEDFQISLQRELPVMSSDLCHYSFPHFNTYLGVVISQETETEILQALESVFQESTEFVRAQDRSPPEDTESADIELAAPQRTKFRRFSELVLKGSTKVSSGLVSTAKFTSKGIKKGGAYLKTKIKKKENPTQISQKTKSTLSKVKASTGAAVVLSRSLVTGVISSASALGTYISAKLSSNSKAQKFTRSNYYQKAKEVGRVGIQAAVTIYDGLEESLVILLSSSKEAAVDVVEHRYGEEAAKFAEDGITCVSNAGNVYRSAKQVGFKKLVKRTAKETGVRMIMYEEEAKEESDIQVKYD